MTNQAITNSGKVQSKNAPRRSFDENSDNEEEENEDELEASSRDDDDFDDEDEEAPDSSDEQDDSDEAQASASSSQKKKRAGGGPRQIYYVCAGITETDEGMDVVMEEIPVTSSEEGFDHKKACAEAQQAFLKKYGDLPSKTSGPYFQRKGGNAVYRKTAGYSDDISKVPLSNRRGEGIWKEWKVTFLYSEDGSRAVIFPQELVGGVKRPGRKPAPKAVPISELSNLKDISNKSG